MMHVLKKKTIIKVTTDVQQCNHMTLGY